MRPRRIRSALEHSVKRQGHPIAARLLSPHGSIIEVNKKQIFNPKRRVDMVERNYVKPSLGMQPHDDV